MKIAVIGGADFIASALCRYVGAEFGFATVRVGDWHEALASCVRTSSRSPHYDVNICEQSMLMDILRFEQVDAIVHLANSNVADTVSVLGATRSYWSELSRGRKSGFRLVNVSDTRTSDLSPDEFFADQYSSKSRSAAASKLLSQELALTWARSDGLPVVLAECGNVFGPCQDPGQPIPRAVTDLCLGRGVEVAGNGGAVQNWTYVDDVVHAVAKLLRESKPGARYDVASWGLPIRAMMMALCSELDAVAPRADGRPHASALTFAAGVPVPDDHASIGDGYAKTEAMRAVLENLTVPLATTVAWYAKNEAWWLPIRLRAFAATARQSTAPYGAVDQRSGAR